MKKIDLHWQQLHPSPLNQLVRGNDLDPAEVESLAASIKSEGLLQPLVVRPTPGGETPFQIIAGERRWRAVKLLGPDAPLLTCLVSQVKDDLDQLVMMGAENLRRQDLSPIQEGRYYQALLDRDLDLKGIVERTGSRREHVRQRLALLDLPRPVQAHIQAQRIPVAAAKHLAKLPPDLQTPVANRCQGKKARTIKAIVEAVLAQSQNGHQNGTAAPSQPRSSSPSPAQTISHLVGLLTGWLEKDAHLFAELAGALSAYDPDQASIAFERADHIQAVIRKVTAGELGR